MKKKYIVKTNKQFTDLINNGYCQKNKYFVIYSKKNTINYDRFGFSVGKKIGNAVTCNKYKRKMRSIIDLYRKDYLNSKDYIIIIRSRALSLNYQELKDELISLLTRKDSK